MRKHSCSKTQDVDTTGHMISFLATVITNPGRCVDLWGDAELGGPHSRALRALRALPSGSITCTVMININLSLIVYNAFYLYY